MISIACLLFIYSIRSFSPLLIEKDRFGQIYGIEGQDLFLVDGYKIFKLNNSKLAFEGNLLPEQQVRGVSKSGALLASASSNVTVASQTGRAKDYLERRFNQEDLQIRGNSALCWTNSWIHYRFDLPGHACAQNMQDNSTIGSDPNSSTYAYISKDKIYICNDSGSGSSFTLVSVVGHRCFGLSTNLEFFRSRFIIFIAEVELQPERLTWEVVSFDLLKKHAKLISIYDLGNGDLPVISDAHACANNGVYFVDRRGLWFIQQDDL